MIKESLSSLYLLRPSLLRDLSFPPCLFLQIFSLPLLNLTLRADRSADFGSSDAVGSPRPLPEELKCTLGDPEDKVGIL